jgi:hypothetical protein
MRKSAFYGILLGGVVIFTGMAAAVERNVPSEYATIQEAINACNNADVVIVAQGTYTGFGNYNLYFGSRVITVQSINLEDLCVVAGTITDCQNTTGRRGFYFNSGEDGNGVISGLTIKRMKITGNPAIGGGIYCRGSFPTIENCVITNNTALGYSGYGGSGDGKNAYGGGILHSEQSFNSN